MGGANKEEVPSTGHGHLMSENGAIFPEFKLIDSLLKLRKGAEIYLVRVGGKEKLIAVFDGNNWRIV